MGHCRYIECSFPNTDISGSEFQNIFCEKDESTLYLDRSDFGKKHMQFLQI